MTALMWVLSWLPLVLPAMSKLPQPVNLSLNSTHFRTMLRWEPGAQTPTGACYQVDFITDRGTSWLPVSGCECVQNPLVCDLTDAFSDPNSSYLAQVTTLLGAQKSDPASYSDFKLIRDSKLYLPVVTATLCDTNLCVDLQFPRFYMVNMSQHHRDIYNNSLKYKLKINDDKTTQVRYLQKHIVEPLGSRRVYCVSVCFWDSLESKESNYSQPVCISTPGVMSADVWISVGLCVLVTLGLLFGAFRLYAGSLKRPLPPVLTSVVHMEDVPIITSGSISDLIVVKTHLPSSGEAGHTQLSSDESDGESETETIEGDDNLREGADLLCFSLRPEPDPQSLPSSQTSNPSETCSSSAITHRLSMNADRGTVGTTESDQKEKEVVEAEDSQDVNLLTLTFGRHNVEEREQESHVDAAASPPTSEECSNPSGQSSHPGDTREVGTETMSCSDDEEDEMEEEGYSEYMGRPCTAVLDRFL